MKKTFGAGVVEQNPFYRIRPENPIIPPPPIAKSETLSCLLHGGGVGINSKQIRNPRFVNSRDKPNLRIISVLRKNWNDFIITKTKKKIRKNTFLPFDIDVIFWWKTAFFSWRFASSQYGRNRKSFKKSRKNARWLHAATPIHYSSVRILPARTEFSHYTISTKICQ